MIALMYSCGLRRDEVANLTLDNYDPEKGRLAVVGKRAKERTAFLTNGTLEVTAD